MVKGVHIHALHVCVKSLWTFCGFIMLTKWWIHFEPFSFPTHLPIIFCVAVSSADSQLEHNPTTTTDATRGVTPAICVHHSLFFVIFFVCFRAISRHYSSQESDKWQWKWWWIPMRYFSTEMKKQILQRQESGSGVSDMALQYGMATSAILSISKPQRDIIDSWI